MGRAPCCDKGSVKRGPWSPEEDRMLREYIHSYGTGGNWITLPNKAGLRRCGKSCRLRWLNYLRPNIRHGGFSGEEDRLICGLFAAIGSRWSVIAAQLPGRTDNDVKNHWNTKLKKKLHLCLIAGLPAPPCVSKPAAAHPHPCFSLEQQQASSGLDMFGVGGYQQHYMSSSSSLGSVDNAGGLHFDTSNSGAVGLEESFIFGGWQQQQQELFPAASENDDIGQNVPDHQRHYLYGGSSRYEKDLVEGHRQQQQQKLLLLGEEGAAGATKAQGNRFLY